jgi:hypothetical protein
VLVHELDRAPKTAQHVASGTVLARLKTLLETGRPTPIPESVGEGIAETRGYRPVAGVLAERPS